MATKKAKTADKPKTTAQQLSSLIKSARDIMRKDKGLNGDLDRLPMLTWVMFLKFLDDLEQVEETRTQLSGKPYTPAIEAPYRWRDWGAYHDGITGDELIAFINNDEAVRPDGKRGPGLFAYLRSLQSTNGDGRRDVIATVFGGVINRMISGYLLRDVVNLIDGIHFNAAEEIHTLSHLYESMLREMRDSAGDSGEFYTPRPVIEFMVRAIDPQLGETLLDPACGTGGFLVESYRHLEKQCKTVRDMQRLQEKSIFGGEAKPLPYMLSQMNLLLHGLKTPAITYGNSLDVRLTEIGNRERVDVILTNPPFGGEEEAGIRGNFPADRQTSETALLFLQLIMRKLKRRDAANSGNGRAAVVVPNGTLYASGVASRIRRSLVEDFRLTTVVRLPKGVFEPYADIPTNILFFTTELAREFVWFYEHPLPPDRAALKTPSYSKSSPLIYEEFEPLLGWWHDRDENEHAWKVSIENLASQDWNLDQKNPHVSDRDVIEPEQLGKLVVAQAKSVREYAEQLRDEFVPLTASFKLLGNAPVTSCTLGEVCDLQKGKFPTKKTPPGPYRFYVLAADERTADSFQLDGEAVVIPTISSTGHGHAAMHRIYYASGQFAVANILAAATIKEKVPLMTRYLYYYLWRYKEEKLVTLMAGTANTSLTLDKLKGVEIEYPCTEVQEAVVSSLDALFESFGGIATLIGSASSMIEACPENVLHYLFRCE